MSQILNWQAIAALQAGDMIATGMASEEALELAEVIGDRFVSRACRLWLANSRAYTGDLAGAVALFREVVAEAEAVHDVLLHVIGLIGQSYAMAWQGDVNGARRTADKAVEFSRERAPHYAVSCTGGAAIACLAAGDAAAAWQLSKVAREQTIEAPMTTGTFLVGAALGAYGCGDLTAARRWTDEAVMMTPGGVFRSWALATRARVELAEGAPEDARRDAREALDIAAASGVTC